MLREQTRVVWGLSVTKRRDHYYEGSTEFGKVQVVELNKKLCDVERTGPKVFLEPCSEVER
jgi:hypothetical protein